MKPDKRFSLFNHIFNRYAHVPGAPAGRKSAGGQLSGLTLPMRARLSSRMLFHRDLHPVVQMLHRATPAHTEMRAFRVYVYPSGFVQLRHLRQLLEGKLPARGDQRRPRQSAPSVKITLPSGRRRRALPDPAIL